MPPVDELRLLLGSRTRWTAFEAQPGDAGLQKLLTHFAKTVCLVKGPRPDDLRVFAMAADRALGALLQHCQLRRWKLPRVLPPLIVSLFKAYNALLQECIDHEQAESEQEQRYGPILDKCQLFFTSLVDEAVHISALDDADGMSSLAHIVTASVAIADRMLCAAVASMDSRARLLLNAAARLAQYLLQHQHGSLLLTRNLIDLAFLPLFDCASAAAMTSSRNSSVSLCRHTLFLLAALGTTLYAQALFCGSSPGISRQQQQQQLAHAHKMWKQWRQVLPLARSRRYDASEEHEPMVAAEDITVCLFRALRTSQLHLSSALSQGPLPAGSSSSSRFSAAWLDAYSQLLVDIYHKVMAACRLDSTGGEAAATSEQQQQQRKVRMQVVVVVSDQLAMLSCISPALRAAVGERMKAVSVELSKVAVGEPESWWVYLRRFLQVGVQQPLAGDSTAAMLSVVLKVMEWSCQLCNRVGPATGLANRLCQVYLEAIRADADAGRAGRALLLRIGPFALLVKHSDCLLWGSFMRTLVSYCKREALCVNTQLQDHLELLKALRVLEASIRLIHSGGHQEEEGDVLGPLVKGSCALVAQLSQRDGQQQTKSEARELRVQSASLLLSCFKCVAAAKRSVLVHHILQAALAWQPTTGHTGDHINGGDVTLCAVVGRCCLYYCQHSLAQQVDPGLIATALQQCRAPSMEAGLALQHLSQRLTASMPLPWFCQNPWCANLEQSTELAVASGAQCLCGGCKVARYCCRACQKSDWHQHKASCKDLAAAYVLPVGTGAARKWSWFPEGYGYRAAHSHVSFLQDAVAKQGHQPNEYMEVSLLASVNGSPRPSILALGGVQVSQLQEALKDDCAASTVEVMVYGTVMALCDSDGLVLNHRDAAATLSWFVHVHRQPRSPDGVTRNQLAVKLQDVRDMLEMPVPQVWRWPLAGIMPMLDCQVIHAQVVAPLAGQP